MSRVRVEHQARARSVALLVLGGCVVVLGVAAGLAPSATGLGTHRQLGFPPCTFVVLTGYPCPTCGMTTAFAHTVRGQFGAALAAQPAGLILALAMAATTGISLSVVVSGRVWQVNWYRVRPAWITVIIIGLLAAGWASKIVVGMISGALPVGGG